jgi:misacylated tRNA(Ala) deacylase
VQLVTQLLHQSDAYLQRFDAVVQATDGARVALDRPAFYATGGGQPHDVGMIGEYIVTDVAKQDSVVWHTLQEPGLEVGQSVSCKIDWDRRYQLMRTHTCLHVMCGVIWNEYGKQVTGGNMEPLVARMDFEFDPFPPGFAETVERRVNEEIEADRPVVVSFMRRSEALLDETLVRTKVNLVPIETDEIRIVDIVGLDKQADGGTHVASTSEIGSMTVVKTESKGRANKRIRIAVT